MSQKTIKIFINEIYSKPPKKNYATNKTDVFHICNIWSLDILDLKDYGPENNRGYRYVSVLIENFSKIGWTVPLKNKKAQTMEDSFEIFLKNSKRKPNLLEKAWDRGFHISIFRDHLKKNNIKLFSIKTSAGAGFAEKFIRTIGNLLKRPVFEKGDDNWMLLDPQ